MDEVLVFGDVVEDVDERLGPAGFGGRDVDAVRADVGAAQVGHDGAVGAEGGVGRQRPVRGRQRGHAQVGQQPEDEVLAPLDEFVAPRHGRPQLERDAWNRVFHPRRLDRARLPRVDFDDVRLRQRRQPGVVWESIVGVGPHRSVGACGQLVCEAKELDWCMGREKEGWTYEGQRLRQRWWCCPRDLSIFGRHSLRGCLLVRPGRLDLCLGRLGSGW